MFFAHDAFDILDHHNRIVDQNTNRQYHAEHGQHIDRVAKHGHHREGTHQ